MLVFQELEALIFFPFWYKRGNPRMNPYKSWNWTSLKSAIASRKSSIESEISDKGEPMSYLRKKSIQQFLMEKARQEKHRMSIEAQGDRRLTISSALPGEKISFANLVLKTHRQKKKTFINPKVVLGTSPPTAGTFTMKSLVGAVLAEASSVEQDVHPYGRGNMYTNAFSGKRSLVHLDPAKLMFWGIVVCLVTGAAFGVIILSEIHRGSLRRLLKRYNGSFPDWY